MIRSSMLELSYFRYTFLNQVDQKETLYYWKCLKIYLLRKQSCRVSARHIEYLLPSLTGFKELLKKSFEKDLIYVGTFREILHFV